MRAVWPFQPAAGSRIAPAAAGAPAGPIAVLLRGPSGAGKSDLALRLIDQGARLVADDQTELTPSDGVLLARAPQSIQGKMEVRGLGIAELAPLCDVPLGLVVDLVDGQSVERLPDSDSCTILGVRLPVVRFDPFEASTPAKLRLALAGRGAAPITGPDADDEPQHPAESAEKDGETEETGRASVRSFW